MKNGFWENGINPILGYKLPSFEKEAYLSNNKALNKKRVRRSKLKNKINQEIMKKTILILIMTLFTSMSFSQSQITINVSQDAKLLFTGDDIGNSHGTLDIAISSEWQGNQFPLGYMFVRPEVEIAELRGGSYRRYSANIGWTFNKVFEGWYKSKVFNPSNISLTSSIGYGFIDYNGAAQSFGANFQTSYQITEYLEVFIDYELTERRDLIRYESEQKIFGTVFRGSGKFGFKVYIQQIFDSLL